jgi:Uma2 family endonuclease
MIQAGNREGVTEAIERGADSATRLRDRIEDFRAVYAHAASLATIWIGDEFELRRAWSPTPSRAKAYVGVSGDLLRRAILRRMANAHARVRPATYADLLSLPNHVVGEIVDGELYATPRPGIPHVRAASRLGAILGPPFDEGLGGPGGWVVLDEPELHFAEDVIVPDLAGWRRERLPVVPEAPFLTLPPDWVCEIVSPSTERIDRVQKLRVYAREGVSYAWLLNPASRTLEVLRLEHGKWVVLVAHGIAEGVVAIDPFGAVPFDLSRVWAST